LGFIFESYTVGQVKLCSPDHVALLIHRTFNVSIPRHHIPAEHWEFEYGAAENDPEFGPGVGGGSEDGEHSEGGSAHEEGEEGGKWVHSITRAKLGGLDGFLEFTVIG
jgi:DNA-directed RNA polymerase I subunit RPA43